MNISVLGGPRFSYGFEEGPGVLRDNGKPLVLHRRLIHHLASHPKRCSSSLDEGSRNLKVHTAGGNKENLGQRSPQRVDISAPPNWKAGKTFTISAPAFHAASISVGVIAPGMTTAL